MREHPELIAVREAKKAMIDGRQAFVDAVHAARAAGLDNMSIAKHAGYTDAAIRMLVRRTLTRR